MERGVDDHLGEHQSGEVGTERTIIGEEMTGARRKRIGGDLDQGILSRGYATAEGQEWWLLTQIQRPRFGSFSSNLEEGGGAAKFPCFSRPRR
ncbi:unnamed protein product [Linum trigynum]|uniref:Uncharacterized protein n=1 Tax=Linum trigynum TaxID=586398 RepID=A0AAV2CUW1_9ROSI